MAAIGQKQTYENVDPKLLQSICIYMAYSSVMLATIVLSN